MREIRGTGLCVWVLVLLVMGVRSGERRAGAASQRGSACHDGGRAGRCNLQDWRDAPPRVWRHALLPQSCTWGGPRRPQCWCSVLLARCGCSVRVSRTLDAQRRRAQGTSAALSW